MTDYRTDTVRRLRVPHNPAAEPTPTELAERLKAYREAYHNSERRSTRCSLELAAARRQAAGYKRAFEVAVAANAILLAVWLWSGLSWLSR